jgi:transposase
MSGKKNTTPELDERMRDAYKLYASGMRTEDIAQNLHIGASTARRYIQNMSEQRLKLFRKSTNIAVKMVLDGYDQEMSTLATLEGNALSEKPMVTAKVLSIQRQKLDLRMRTIDKLQDLGEVEQSTQKVEQRVRVIYDVVKPGSEDEDKGTKGQV